MNIKILASLVLLSAVLIHEPANATHVVLLAQAEMARGEGEVRKVDKAAGKVTIKHGPLEGINMPAMTMVFRPKDAAMLDNLKEGDQIKFTASRRVHPGIRRCQEVIVIFLRKPSESALEKSLSDRTGSLTFMCRV